jgi:DNA polymerase-1
MSSSKPNLQNLARDEEEEVALQLNVKRQYISRFVVEPCMVENITWEHANDVVRGTLSEADQSQLELRVAAIMSNDKNMMDAFMRGTDVHTELAAMMRGIRPDQVTKAIRQAGKTTNFHVLYGGAAFGLSLRLGCSKSEAEALIARFYSTFTGFEEWQREQERFAKENLYVESMFGRRRHFVQPRSWKAPEGKRILRQAVNAPIQGDASAITNIGLVQAMKRMKRETLRSKMFLTVHDSGLTDNYPGEEEQVHTILREEMENPNTLQFGVNLTLPLKVDIKTGPTWGSMVELVTA